MVSRMGDAGAVVVLGCRTGPDGGLTGVAERRVRAAAEAWHRFGGTLIASGGRRWYGVAETEAMAAALIRQGVPSSAVVREWWSTSTAENAAYVARILNERGLGRAVLVTCDWHMARARRCFARAGIAVSPWPSPSPPVGAGRAWLRGLRERLSYRLDSAATWGFAERV